jgi:predicted nucleotidyltransferase
MSNKKIKYSINGAIIVGLGNGLINLFKQRNNNIDATPINWWQCIRASLNGAAVGGVGGFIIGSIEDKRMSRILHETGGTVPKYLNYTLKQFDDSKCNVLHEKANQLKRKLYREYKGDLTCYPNFNGSAVKGTSIQGSDIDIQLRFKKQGQTIEENFNDVLNFLEEELHDPELNGIRTQKHSIGITFKINGEKHRIDVVPSRASMNAQQDDYIYVNNTSFFGKPTFKKINSKKQLKGFNFNSQEKRVVKLLKVLKKENSLNIKSIYLELLVKKAFENNRMPINTELCLHKVLKYIADNIQILRIIDPANTNNVISDTLTYSEKEIISDYCYSIVNNLEKDKRNIIDYFPIN